MDKRQREPAVTRELALGFGLTEEEYGRIIEILGRVPTYTELGIYSVMWSEHCSYKNSIAELKTLPRSGEQLLVNAGEENAGLVDIGDGLAVAFKIESHNHPSAVEPYQGAATGVGGIMRDIFTMGARPIAALNSLRFGSLKDARSRRLFRGVVKGIGDYGNSFGVPTVAGEVYFDNCYRDNPIVNAMAVGIVKHSEVASAVAKGIGNPVMIVGAATGRDGIHGATFASEEISDKSEHKRPSVQVGDPFTEKLLLEATLEANRAACLVGIQDMGAAGITCSTTEMSAKGRAGMKINLDKVPVRETGMSAYEIMLSESQERMLLVARKGSEDKIKEIFEKWDLHAVVVGEVTGGTTVQIFKGGELKAEVPADSLVLGGGAPVYVREAKEPAYVSERPRIDFRALQAPTDLADAAMKILTSPNIASKRWVFEQYDTSVRTDTVVMPGSDAAVVRIKGTDKFLAMKTDCNARYVYLNPHKGAEIAVAEACRNVICSGGRVLGITNCLNFGNPYKPGAFWQFKEAVAGIREACNAFGVPVTGGNVSFYNDSQNASIYPTPVIGTVGLIENEGCITTNGFKEAGEDIILIGNNLGDVNGSEYLALMHGSIGTDAPHFDLEEEKRVQSCCRRLIQSRLVSSAHDISEGGIATALIESAMSGALGCSVDSGIEATNRADFVLFGEEQSRIIVTAPVSNRQAIFAIAAAIQVPTKLIGEVTRTNDITVGRGVGLRLDDVTEAYENAIKRVMDEQGTD